MQEKRGADAVVACLESWGVDTVFGYPGGANLPIYDALHASKIKHVLARHEQGAGLMANGYGRIKHAPGVCLVTSGPGVTNVITALADAYLDSVPMVTISGQIPRDFIGTDAFQEVDCFNLTLPVTKHNELVSTPEDLVPAMQTAFHVANTGRKGPVLVDIPRDIQEHKGLFLLNSKRQLLGYQPTTHAHIGQIKRCLRALKRATSPLFLLGGGIARAQAEQEFFQFAKATNIPVVRTLMGKAAFPEGDELYLGMIGTHGNVDANKAISKADLVFAIGTRFGDRSTLLRKQEFLRHAKIIHLDIDPAEISKTIPVDIPVVGDIKDTLIRLLKEIQASGFEQKTPWARKKNDANILWKGEHGGVIGTILQEMSKIDEKLHITTDVGRHQMWATHACSNARHWPILTSGGLGTMGFGLPAAIGAWFAEPTVPVVNISGDGSFFMNIQEFMVAVEYSIPLIVFVINDMRLGMIRELQEARFGGRHIAHQFPTSNFSEIARAFGGQGFHLTSKEQIYPTLKKTLSSGLPTVIDLELEAIAMNADQRLAA